MASPTDERLRKQLTANDLGLTGSHQAGIHVPMNLAGFFPVLDASKSNPDRWLSITAGSRAYRWRYIYYNGRLFGTGTRNEYRLTRARQYLADAGAAIGDTLELQQLGANEFGAAIIRARSVDDPIILSLAGRWSLIRVMRA